MRLLLGATAVVVLVVGGFWLVLALLFSHSPTGGSSGDGFALSATCVRDQRSLSLDRADAARFKTAGLRTLGLRWNGVRAVALFDDALSGDSVGREEARIASSLRSQGVSAAEINARLLGQDNVALFYVSGSPSQAAQAAIGRCVYLVHFNRIASAVGLYISPHAERPFLPGAEREH
jgi:hypothetical protein